MALKFNYVERPKDVDACIQLLDKAILPLLTENWKKYGAPYYGKPFLMNVGAFVTHWMERGLVMVLAYENDDPVGILTGLRFTPMSFATRVLQIDTCYGKTSEIEKALYNYIKDLGPVLEYDELWVTTDTCRIDAIPMKKIASHELVRFTRE